MAEKNARGELILVFKLLIGVPREVMGENCQRNVCKIFPEMKHIKLDCLRPQEPSIRK